MRNKTPWLWQNFWEGLADEAMPNASVGNHKATRGDCHRHHAAMRRNKARLTDESLPDPRPLLERNLRDRAHGGYNETRTAAHRPSSETDGTAVHPDYIVVEHKNLSEYHDDVEPKTLQYERPVVVASVPKWQLEEQEELNPRWAGLADSFKDSGVQ